MPLHRLTGAIFLLPIAHVADRCPNISRKTILVTSIMLYSLTMGLASLARNGIILDLMLGAAGLACAAHIPIMSSLLTSIYSVPSKRRHFVFTCFLAGGNAFAVLFGNVGSGLATDALGGDWRGTCVYIAVMYAIVALIGVLTVPNMPRNYPTYIVSSGSEDRYTLLRRGIEKRSSMTD